MNVLITGVAGFLGYHVAERLLTEGHKVIGIDNLNPYYDPRLKRARLEKLEPDARFAFTELDVADRVSMAALFEIHRFDRVIHLAAQAGVRHSIENPHLYAESNITGFLNVLEGCRARHVAHLIYASSSSVYAGNRNLPFSTEDRVDSPISFYAATKKSNELMAHCYSHLYGFATTGLRLFTVYGPWGRPDMASDRFLKGIDLGRQIDVYDSGRMRRDFTFISDAVEAIGRLAAGPSEGYRLFNVGTGYPIDLMDLIGTLERALGRPAHIRFLPFQPGDMVETHADVAPLYQATGFRPATTIGEGIEALVCWYRAHRGAEWMQAGVGTETPDTREPKWVAAVAQSRAAG